MNNIYCKYKTLPFLTRHAHELRKYVNRTNLSRLYCLSPIFETANYTEVNIRTVLSS